MVKEALFCEKFHKTGEKWGYSKWEGYKVECIIFKINGR